MVTTKLNLSMTEPQVRQIYAKQGDTGRVLDITLDQTPEDGTLRILRPDGTEVTSEAVTGGEVESGSTFESLTEADVTELTVGIEPVQDLNGYDAPWVGGAGKNKMPTTATSRTVSGVNITINDDGSFHASGTATADIYLNLGDASASANTWIASCGVIGSWNTYGIYIRNVTDSVTINMIYVQNYTFTLSDTKTIRFILFIKSGQAMNTDFYPMLRLSTETDATFAPYSNICPITGHDEVTVTDVGKNRALFANESNQDRASFTYESETANKIVATSTSTGKFVGRYEAFLVKGVSYKALFTNKGASVSPYIYRDRLWGSLVRTVFSGEVFTVDTTQTYVIGIYAPAQSTYDVEDFMVIEASETDTSWTPYQGSTYTTSLGQTVYGGTLDMVSGVLTVDRAYYSATWANGGNATSLGSYTRKAFDLGVANLVKPSMERCNVAPYVNNYILDELHFYCYNSRAYVFLPNDTDGATPIQVCFALVTPLTYTLTAQQIKTLVGTNNVWASSGDIVNITFTYGGLLSELPSEATEIVGKCYCDVEQNGVSSMPFTLNVKKNERES